jgi:hypothetical protein
MRGQSTSHPKKRRKIHRLSRVFFIWASISLIVTSSVLTIKSNGLWEEYTTLGVRRITFERGIVSGDLNRSSFSNEKVGGRQATTQKQDQAGVVREAGTNSSHHEDQVTIYTDADEDRGELERPGMISYSMGQRTRGTSNISWRSQQQQGVGEEDPWPFYKIGIEEGTGHKVVSHLLAV